MEAERVLQAKGFDPGRVDGNVDTQFIQALRAFQKKNNLQTTGDLDKATLAVLDAAGARFTGTLRATRNPPGATDDLSAGEAKPGK
jgi:peptidoglycan hydrolase-like protein with peptidoglycan-binding domain